MRSSLFICYATALTPYAYSYIQFTASKATSASHNDASKGAFSGSESAANSELLRAREEITELRVQLSDLSLGLSNKISELTESQREISRLQSLLQAR